MHFAVKWCSCELCLPLTMPPRSVVVVTGRVPSGSVIRSALVHFSGYRAQQREERSSVAQEHQETRHRDLFQWWYLQDLRLWIRFVRGREGFCSSLLSRHWARLLILWTFPQIWRPMNGAKSSRWSVWARGSMTSASESLTCWLLGLRENRVVCKENSLLRSLERCFCLTTRRLRWVTFLKM